MTVLMTPMFVPVLAQSNHTLEWGVSPGEEFTYVLQRAFYADSSSEEFLEAQLPFIAELQPGQKTILEIDHLDTIATLINESSQLPRSYCNMLRENDSAVILSDQIGLVIPIGDWGFLNEVENITGTTGLSLVDTENEWGTIGTGVISGSGGSDINVRIEMRYEKENGTLSYLRHRYTTLGNDLIDMIFVHWYPGMPTIVGGGIQTTTLIIIAVSSLAGLVIAFVVYRGVKSRKSVAQMLGE
ncbi:MAG: hypothetical protein PVJ05_15960 [Candidatus Thorarchaeota archaeon]|jgi:hypothetical protein